MRQEKRTNNAGRYILFFTYTLKTKTFRQSAREKTSHSVETTVPKQSVHSCPATVPDKSVDVNQQRNY